MRWSAPSRLKILHSLTQTCHTFPVLLLPAGQSMSDWSSGRPRCVKISTTSIVYSPSFSVWLNSISVHILATSTSFCLGLILLFLKQRSILRCFISCPVGMWIPHMSHWYSVSPPFCSTTTFVHKCLYMQCSCILLMMWDFSRNPVTGNSTKFIILGKDTTYVVGPPPSHSNSPRLWQDYPMWLLQINVLQRC